MASSVTTKNNVWRSHVRNLFDEIMVNPGTRILKVPLQITINILAEAAQYAGKSGDEKMIGYFARLAIYAFSDPTDKKDFDQQRTDNYINKTKDDNYLSPKDELLNALEEIVKSWDDRSGGEREVLKKGIMKDMPDFWSPSASLVSSPPIAKARELLNKYKKDDAK